jgi:hypothetical protein
MAPPRHGDTELVRAAQRGQPEARERIVADNLWIVRSLAAHYTAISASRSTTSFKKDRSACLMRSTAMTPSAAPTSRRTRASASVVQSATR